MIKAIVTDIEGTTSSLSFVKDVLFPYARANLTDYVRRHKDEPQVKTLLEDTCKEVGAELDAEQIIAQLIQWIDEDKKVTPLKSLQGLIWESGYQKGDFKGHVTRMPLLTSRHGKPKDWIYTSIRPARYTRKNYYLHIRNTAI